MGRNNTKPVALHSEAETSAQIFHDWFDPIETGVRAQVRSFIESMIESELEAALSRTRYGHPAKAKDGADSVAPGLSGHRHGHRSRSLTGTFGQVEIRVPRARLLTAADGKTSEWKSKTTAGLPATHAGCGRADRRHLPVRHRHARVRRALAALFGRMSAFAATPPASAPMPKQGFRSAIGILGLVNATGRSASMPPAHGRSCSTRAPTSPSPPILRSGKDKAPAATPDAPILFRPNIRGRGCYN